MTLSMAADLVREGIRVNAVNPGTADTPWIGRLLSKAADPAAERAALEARQPHGRLVSAEEVAAAIAFLHRRRPGPHRDVTRGSTVGWPVCVCVRARDDPASRIGHPPASGQGAAVPELHAEVWPDVLATLKRAHISNYSIFLRDGYCSATWSTAALISPLTCWNRSDAATRRWWLLTDPCQLPLTTAAAGERWAPAEEELFHLD